MKIDPFAKNEAARYENPIPSREAILAHLEDAGTPLSFKRLTKELNLDRPDARDALTRRLNAMVRDHQILVDRRNTYKLTGLHDQIQGHVVADRDGTGRIVGASQELQLNRKEMQLVLPGDEVEARMWGRDHRGHQQGRIIRVTAVEVPSLVGTCYRENNAVFVQSLRQRRQFKVNGGGVTENQVIRFAPERDELGRLTGNALLLDVLGDELNLELVTSLILQENDIPVEFSSASLDQAARYGDIVDAAEHASRQDLRKLDFVTIDGVDARDFDDAVYCQRQSSGWRLMVAIADVAHYVRPQSSLDREAFERGNSVYFPQLVVPMLPEMLSNGLCSLNPAVDRLCLVCDMQISSNGKLTRFEFSEAIIHSSARLTYTRVAEILQQLEIDESSVTDPIYERLAVLQQVYRVLLRSRNERSALEFESTELLFDLDDDQRLRSIDAVVRNDAHRLIEECMLCANVAAARFLKANKLPGLYRVHEGPDIEKLEDLRTFLSLNGVSLGGGKSPGPEDYCHALDAIRGRANGGILQTVLLRSMSQAVYQPQNLGHFGLNYPEYAHFTSPIRRYPDLLMHRAIKSVIHGKSAGKHVIRHAGHVDKKWSGHYPYESDDLAVYGDQCSMTERRAEKVVYDVIGFLKCQYMEQHVGDEFEGIITGVTRFGLFIEIGEFRIEGLAHISTLSDDYYLFDPGRQVLLGERTGRAYRLGDVVKVQVVRVQSDERKIDCELLGHNQSAGEKSAPRTPRTPRHKRPQKGKRNKERRF